MSSSSVELLDGSSMSWKDTAVYLSPRRRSFSFYSSSVVPLVLSSLFLFFGAIIALVLLLGLRLPAPVPVNPYYAKIFEDKHKIRLLNTRLRDSISGERILDSIKWLAKEVHVAGTAENDDIIRRLGDQYTKYGYVVRFFEYNVMLSYPNYSRPNTIEVFDDESQEWLRESDTRAGVWWSAYSANGTVEGNLVYANYGRSSDFDMLESMGVSVTGKVILMRFGGVARSLKVAEAENRGAIGVILFSDPILSGPGGGNNSFPSVMALPGDDVQRGGVLRTVGDPETPTLPSLSYVPRINVRKLRNSSILPRIPVTPVGSDIAVRLMRLLDGRLMQEHRWQGGLAADYRLTGTRRFRLTVSSTLERRPIRNVIATLRGSLEPDVWIMMGNHVDAWVNGAIDPGTATATQLEVARVFAEASSHSPPRRSIVFCHWDAEEFGLIGSSEWIEDMGRVLEARAVSMLNIDHVAGNVTLQVKAVPLLYRVLADSADRHVRILDSVDVLSFSVEQTDEFERENGRVTLLDSWKYHGGSGPLDEDSTLPPFGLPGGASDHQRFISLMGIPSADVKMISKGRSSYPLYHSMHEVPWSVEQFISQDGLALAAIARFSTEFLSRMANHLIIPFSASDYARTLSQWLTNLHARLANSGVSKFLRHYDHLFRELLSASAAFRDAAEQLDSLAMAITDEKRGVSIGEVNRINNRLMQLERVFLDKHAFTSPLHRHLVYSPTKLSTFRSPFAVVLEAAHDWAAADPLHKDIHLDEIAIAIARITHAMQVATELLSIDDLN